MNIINSVRLEILALKYCLPNPHPAMYQNTWESHTFLPGEWKWEKLSLRYIGAVNGD